MYKYINISIIYTHTPTLKLPQELPWQLLILLSPPAMKLHEHIASCVELSKNKFSADAGDEEGALNGAQWELNGLNGPKKTSSPWYITMV